MKSLLILAAVFAVISAQAQVQAQPKPAEPATPFSGNPPTEEQLAQLPRCQGKGAQSSGLVFDTIAYNMNDSDLEFIYKEVMTPIDRKNRDKYKTSACFSLGKFTVTLLRFQDMWDRTFKPYACPNENSKRIVAIVDTEIEGMIAENRVLEGYCDPVLSGAPAGALRYLPYNDDIQARTKFDVLASRYMHFQGWAHKQPEDEIQKTIAQRKAQYLKGH